MKKILLLPFILLLQFGYLSAQSFEEAMDLYNSDQFAEANAIFDQIDDSAARLFSGKSYLAVGQYHYAIAQFNEALNAERQNIRHEALYSLAIAQFRLKKYDLSLTNLKQLIESDNRTGLRMDAQRFYRQIMNYLTVEERFQTLQRSEAASIRYDLVNNSKTYVDETTYNALVTALLRMEPDSLLRNELTESLLAESDLQQFFNRYPTAPQGMVYHIGVVLPTFDQNDPEFTIPRNLYYGMILAADEFNSRNADKKVKLIFKNSAEDPDTTAKAVTELAWAHRADAVIGPLFSEPAKKMAQLAEEFRLPMFAPLANSDELNLDYNYTFQLNPTFEVHGKNMARFAVQELGLDTLAVITEKGSLGRNAALGFRKEAERLGAYISYFIDEDFSAIGYDLSEFTKVFTPDTALIDSLGYTPTQALYAPFTGQAATTMTNLLMNDLEAMRSEIVILGSEEWAGANLSAYQQRIFEIYYTEAFGVSADTTAIEYFEEDFQTRFGTSADRFARVGYDTGNYLFQSLETAGNPSYLGRALRTAPEYNGMALRVHFDGKRINQHVYIEALTPLARERFNQGGESVNSFRQR
ncbi:MAG: amino acid ABC transporter substrate-binding protein [Balneolaceae bacterium]|nr:MAG: amino acid ABC transporter substrate-binding protein [Balneolaceae bacterium]